MIDSSRGLYRPVFVLGMPRSGTTLLSALISTSSSCNPFTPEPHYLGHLCQTIANLYLPYQSCFYTDRESVIASHFDFFRSVVDGVWKSLGRPPILVLKHVFMTTVCHLIGRHFPEAQFVAIMRDPCQTFASLRESLADDGPESKAHTELLVRQWLRRFNHYYSAVIRAANGELKGRVLAVDHELLCQGEFDSLSDFLRLRDIDPELLWKRFIVDIQDYKDDPLFSTGWGKPLHPSAVRPHSQLNDGIAEMISRDTRTVRGQFASLVRRSTADMA